MILVIFGSKSDAHIYEPLLIELKSNGIEYDFFVASAHKAPNYLEEVLNDVNNRYKLIIAGAGLAAHLPGIIASKTIRPVIGLPVDCNFEGMDALMSIMQMPPSVPVLSVGVNKTHEALLVSKLLINKVKGINITKKSIINEKNIKKIQKIFSKFDVDFEYSESLKNEVININPVPLADMSHIPDDKLIINIPIKESSNLDDLESLNRITQNGIWVGLNRFDNACIAALQILNLNDKFSNKLLEFKHELEMSFRDAT